ncbi:MAG: hypothetical protein WDW36_008762 [Sanguina aurantia]
MSRSHSRMSINFLRYGVTPVFVLEGKTPDAKQDTVTQRGLALYGSGYQGGGSRGNREFHAMGREVARVLLLLGLPVITAPGEAEAMCAALNEAGHVDYVQSTDGDAFLFGAQRVLKDLHLQASRHSLSTLAMCGMSAVRRVLGLKEGGRLAVLAVAQLCGGDYNQAGSKGVGGTLAFNAVRELLRGAENDDAVLQRLHSALDAAPDEALLGLSGCSGCRRCGHESGAKGKTSRHGKRGCGGCSTAGTTQGGCAERAPGSECQCEFHRRGGARELERTLRKTRATGGAEGQHLQAWSRSLDGYHREYQQARAAVAELAAAASGGRPAFRWLHRPDMPQLLPLLETHLKWTAEAARVKLLHLLIEWDIAHGGDEAAEFRPISITKQAGKPASKPKPPTKDLPESASFFSQQGGGTQRNPEPGSTSGRTGSSSQAPLNYSQGGSDCDGDGDSGVGLESQFAGLQSQTQQLLRCLDGNRDAQAEGRGEGDAGPEAALPWRYAVKLERLAGRNPQHAEQDMVSIEQDRSLRYARCSVMDSAWPEIVELFKHPPPKGKPQAKARATAGARAEQPQAAAAQPRAKGRSKLGAAPTGDELLRMQALMRKSVVVIKPAAGRSHVAARSKGAGALGQDQDQAAHPTPALQLQASPLAQPPYPSPPARRSLFAAACPDACEGDDCELLPTPDLHSQQQHVREPQQQRGGWEEGRLQHDGWEEVRQQQQQQQQHPLWLDVCIVPATPSDLDSPGCGRDQYHPRAWPGLGGAPLQAAGLGQAPQPVTLQGSSSSSTPCDEAQPGPSAASTTLPRPQCDPDQPERRPASLSKGLVVGRSLRAQHLDRPQRPDPVPEHERGRAWAAQRHHDGPPSTSTPTPTPTPTPTQPAAAAAAPRSAAAAAGAPASSPLPTRPAATAAAPDMLPTTQAPPTPTSPSLMASASSTPQVPSPSTDMHSARSTPMAATPSSLLASAHSTPRVATPASPMTFADPTHMAPTPPAQATAAARPTPTAPAPPPPPPPPTTTTTATTHTAPTPSTPAAAPAGELSRSGSHSSDSCPSASSAYAADFCSLLESIQAAAGEAHTAGPPAGSPHPATSPVTQLQRQLQLHPATPCPLPQPSSGAQAGACTPSPTKHARSGHHSGGHPAESPAKRTHASPTQAGLHTAAAASGRRHALCAPAEVIEQPEGQDCEGQDRASAASGLLQAREASRGAMVDTPVHSGDVDGGVGEASTLCRHAPSAGSALPQLRQQQLLQLQLQQQLLQLQLQQQLQQQQQQQQREETQQQQGRQSRRQRPHAQQQQQQEQEEEQQQRPSGSRSTAPQQAANALAAPAGVSQAQEWVEILSSEEEEAAEEDDDVIDLT